MTAYTWERTENYGPCNETLTLVVFTSGPYDGQFGMQIEDHDGSDDTFTLCQLDLDGINIYGAGTWRIVNHDDVVWETNDKAQVLETIEENFGV